ncbi:MAG: reverse transcriptase domain-containing protein, partial [Sedimenticola sp.]
MLQEKTDFFVANGNLSSQLDQSPSDTNDNDIYTIPSQNSDINNRVKLYLERLSISALVDTGASVSILNYKAYKRSKVFKKAPLQNTTIHNIKGVNGVKSSVLGKVEISVKIANVLIPHEFLVVKDIQYELILGIDFMKSTKAEISFNDGYFSIYDDFARVPLQTYQEHEPSVLYYTTESINISPESISVITLHSKTKQEHKMVLLNPVNKLFNIYNAIGAKTISSTNNNVCYFQIMNPTENEIHIPAKTIIASAEKIDENDEILNFDLDQTYIETTQDEVSSTVTETEMNSKLKDMGIELPDSLSQSQLYELKKLIIKYEGCFAKNVNEIINSKLPEFHDIKLTSEKPVQSNYYRHSPAQTEEIKRQVEQLQEAGIIEESDSIFRSPCLLVKKKSPPGSKQAFRLVVDYRKLNAQTLPINFPLVQFQTVVDQLGASKFEYLTSLDCFQGYHQVKLNKTAKQYTSFVTEFGQYTYNYLPYGLKNAPACFQRCMSQLFRKYNFKFLLCYIDDILIYSRSFEEHLNHLEQVFATIQKACVKLRASKCEFMKEKLKYLGHIFTKQGVQADSAKTNLIRNYKRPTTVKELKQFLGLAQFYKKFIKDFSKICKPLHELTSQKRKFQWTDEAQQAFDQLKQKLINPPILQFPQFDQKFYLWTDSSDFAVGFVLGQKDENGRNTVILYGGKQLNKCERAWSSTERECFAVFYAIKQCHCYLADKSFTVYSDHQALTSLTKTSRNNGRLMRWSLLLSGYDFDIEYIPGKRMTNADFLSRMSYDIRDEQSEHKHSKFEKMTDQTQKQPSVIGPDSSSSCEIGEQGIHQSTGVDAISTMFQNRTDNCSEQVNVLSYLFQAESQINDTNPLEMITQFTKITAAEMSRFQHEDPELKPLVNYLMSNELPFNNKSSKDILIESQDYVLDEGILFHFYYSRGKQRDISTAIKQLVIPSALKEEILKACHDCSAHFGVEKTFLLIRSKFFWKKQYQDVKNYVQSCHTCQISNRDYSFAKAPLCPLKTPSRAFELLEVDLVGPLPKTQEGYEHIIVFCDHFSKYPIAYPLKATDTKTIVQLFYDNVISVFGPPTFLLSDNGSNLVSKLMKELCKSFNIQKINSTSYHPQTQGLVERLNGIIGSGLRKHSNTTQDNWPMIISHVLYGYRSAPCKPHGKSPFEVLYGFPMTTMIENALPNVKPNLPIKDRQVFEEILKGHEITRQLAYEKMKSYRENYTQQYNKKAKNPTFQVNNKVLLKECRLLPGKCKKLSQRFIGPFKIVKVHDKFTYTLQRVSDGYILQKKIHANRLKTYFDRKTTKQMRENKKTTKIQDATINDKGPKHKNDISDIFLAKRLLRKRYINKQIYYDVEWVDNTVS